MVRVKIALAILFTSSAWLFASAPTTKPEVPLWQLPPFDRVHLVDGNHYDIDPIRIPAETQFAAKANEYIGRLGLPMAKPEGEQRAAIYHIRKVEDGMTYELIGRSLASVEYFEEMLLEQANRLIDLRQFDEAVDYLRTVDALDPDWDTRKRSNWREGTNWNRHLYSLLETRIRFHRAEAAMLTDSGRLERAFWSLVEEKRLLEQLRAKSEEPVDDEQLSRRFDQLIDRWMKRLLDIEKDYRGGRQVICRMEQIFPKSEVVTKWRAVYARQIERVLGEAAAAQRAEKMPAAFEALERALTIDPGAPSVRTAVEQFYKSYPVLKVAAARLPSYTSGPAEWSPDDWRCSDLIHLPIMWLKSMEGGGTFASDLIEQPKRENINQRATITLHANQLRWPGDNKMVTATDLERLLAGACQSSSPLYHPALAPLVQGMRTLSPTQMRIDFNRPQFQPGAWLQSPFFRISHDPSAGETASEFPPARSGLGPFRIMESRRNRAVFAANPAFLRSGKPVIKQVLEIRYPTSAHRLRALQEREVHMIDYVPPRHHAHVEKMAEAKLYRQSRPRVHVIQFNLHRRELRNSNVRRAIAYAINREGACEKVGIKLDDDNRLLATPLPYGSFGTHAELSQRQYDPYIAQALLMALRRQFKALPPLTLAHAGNETSYAACESIVADLNRVGLKVSLVDLDENATLRPLNADLRYVIYDVTDPIFQLVTILTRDNPSLAQYASPWLRDALVRLLQVPNITEAREVLPELHRILYGDTAILPLWQWYDYYAVSDAVSGIPKECPTFYHEVAGWSTRPRFPERLWASMSATGATEDIHQLASVPTALVDPEVKLAKSVTVPAKVPDLTPQQISPAGQLNRRVGQ